MANDIVTDLIRAKMIRRYIMRRITLQRLRSGNPITSVKEMMQDLKERGISLLGAGGVDSFRREMDACRLVFVKHVEYKGRVLIPLPYHPERHEVMVDSELVVNEVLRRVVSHVRYIDRQAEWVFINCEKMTGKMFAEPMFLLTWPEIAHILPGDHSVMVLCVDEEAASRVHGMLLGEGLQEQVSEETDA